MSDTKNNQQQPTSQTEPAPIQDAELDLVAGAMRPDDSRYRSNPQAMACC